MNTDSSNTSNHSSKQNYSDISAEYIPAASHYALKLAFQTMKERYDNLQQRLCAIEEENINLKENQNNAKLHSDNSSLEMVAMEQKINELSRQKAQLSHHTFMLANENKDLWSNISKLTEEKEILVNKLKELTIKVNNEQTVDSSAESIGRIKDVDDKNKEDPPNDYSATEEDDKESLQSIETVKDFSIIKTDRGEYFAEDVNNELKELLNKLIDDKAILQQQQAGLKHALASIKRIYQGMKMYIMYLQRLKTDNELSIQNSDKDLLEAAAQTCKESINDAEKLKLNDKEKNEYTDEMICPFCGKYFVKNTSTEEYNKHFLIHVQNCSSSNCSSLVLESFEVIG